jgi:subtilisin family serine protease
LPALLKNKCRHVKHAAGLFKLNITSLLGNVNISDQYFLPTGENFAMMSSTSMDAPHVAGLAALNKSPATPFDMGSGFVNATAALNPGLLFDSNKSVNELLNHYTYNVYGSSNNSEISKLQYRLDDCV